MNFVTFAILVLGAVTSASGILVMFRNLKASSEGYQDTQGFHYGRPSEELLIRSSVVHARVLEKQSAG